MVDMPLHPAARDEMKYDRLVTIFRPDRASLCDPAQRVFMAILHRLKCASLTSQAPICTDLAFGRAQ
jgi:hypothetical protein